MRNARPLDAQGDDDEHRLPSDVHAHHVLGASLEDDDESDASRPAPAKNKQNGDR